MNKPVAIGIIVAVVVLGGGALLLLHNKSNDTNSTTSTTTSSTSSTTSSHDMSESSKSLATETPNATGVTIENFAFSPANITVKKGTTVTWTNKDSATHTVTETDSQKGPDSGNLAQGKAYSFTYDTAGTFKYHCAIHPDMTGTVTVTE